MKLSQETSPNKDELLFLEVSWILTEDGGESLGIKYNLC